MNAVLILLHTYMLESDQQNSPREIQRPVTPPAFSNGNICIHDPLHATDKLHKIARMQMSPEKYIGQSMHPKAQMTIQHNQKSQIQRPGSNRRDFHPAHQQQGPYNRMVSRDETKKQSDF